MSETTKEVLDTIARILLRCWIIGFALQILTFAALLLLDDFLYQLYATIFDLTTHDANLIIVTYMSAIKLFVTIFFFIPWLAIWLLLNKEKL